MRAISNCKHRPTLADIARLAGLHPSTVSLALRNQPGIAAATRERINHLADKMDYRPDPLLTAFCARRMRRTSGGRRRAIAFVSDQIDRKALAESDRHREILAGAEEQAGSLGLCLNVFFAGPGRLSPARLRQVLRARGIVGVIIGAFGENTRMLPVNCDGLCAVAVESMHLEPRLDAVATNYREAARIAVRKLHESGHRHILFALDSGLPEITRQQLRAGYLVEQFNCGGMPVPPFWMVNPGRHFVIPSWVRRSRPDALVCCGWTPLPGRLPGTVAVIDAQSTAPGLPGVPAVYRALGRRAVEMLALRLKANQTGLPAHVSTTFLPVIWRGGST